MIPCKYSTGWRDRTGGSAQKPGIGNLEEPRGNTALARDGAIQADIEIADSSHNRVPENPEVQREDKSSSYIFLRTPQKLGEKLMPNEENPPEGFGMYFEESLKVGRLFMFVLFLYLSGTLVFGVVWYREFGMAGPQSGLGAFGVSSWMVSLISIITTVWLKWAD